MEKEREIAAAIVDEFESFLAEKGIDIPNPDKVNSECPAILYGEDYYSLEDKVTDIIKNQVTGKAKRNFKTLMDKQQVYGCENDE